MITDFHSHVLPGIDDGSRSVAESIAMLQAEAEQGITHVIATPHFYAHRTTPERFLEKRNQAEMRLREEMEKYPGLPRLGVGAEIYFFNGISDCDAINLLTIGGNRCILLEMGDPPWGDSAYREMMQIWQKQGLTPVIAHVDRYIGPWRDYGISRFEDCRYGEHIAAEGFDKWNDTRRDLTARFTESPAVAGRVEWCNRT